MPHIDQGTFFALILTLCETIAIGGIAAVLLLTGIALTRNGPVHATRQR